MPVPESSNHFDQQQWTDWLPRCTEGSLSLARSPATLCRWHQPLGRSRSIPVMQGQFLDLRAHSQNRNWVRVLVDLLTPIPSREHMVGEPEK